MTHTHTRIDIVPIELRSAFSRCFALSPLSRRAAGHHDCSFDGHVCVHRRRLCVSICVFVCACACVCCGNIRCDGVDAWAYAELLSSLLRDAQDLETQKGTFTQ